MIDTSLDIIELIHPHSRVLDLGCGEGELLDFLIQDKGVKGYGIEIDPKKIVACVARGIPVFQGNIDEGLPEFSDHSFDYVILSQTLQEVQKPLFVISEMLRIGKKAIVSFPNFAHWAIRLHLLIGKAPKAESLPFDWFNTPNIRLITLSEFRSLCRSHGFHITADFSKPYFLSNLFAKQGIFVIEKQFGKE